MLDRKQLRLVNYDYSSAGIYFITICTFQKKKTFGDILRRGDPCGLPRTALSELGALAEETIREIEIPNRVSVDKYVVMPNHVHLLLRLYGVTPDSRKGCHYGLEERYNHPEHNCDIPQIISKYKSLVANKWLGVCKSRNQHMGTIWQRSYHDHIIRDERDYLARWQYIDENPLKWEFDKYYR